MPEQRTMKRAKKAKREGKSPSTQAGEFVHEEIRHVRQGKHGARSPEQAIAIGLSKARRAGVDVPEPRDKKGSPSRSSGKKRSTAKKRTNTRSSKRRSEASKNALKRERRSSASTEELSSQTRRAAKRRSPSERSASARRGARHRSSSSASGRRSRK